MVDIPKTLTLPILPIMRELARLVAQQRHSGHDGRRTASQNRGGDHANYQADFWGVLAEILVTSEIERLGRRPTYSLLHCQQGQSADLVETGQPRLDVKAVPADKHFACINEVSHRAGRADAYLVVHFTSEDYAEVYKPVSHDEVDKWVLRDDRHSPYRSQHLGLLKPLHCLSDLVGY